MMTMKTANRFLLGFGVLFALGTTAIFVLCVVYFSQTPESFIVTEGQVEGDQVSRLIASDSPIQFRHLSKSQTYADFDTEQLSVDAAELIDVKTGDVLLAKNPDTPHALASLSKLVSVLYLFNRGFHKDQAADVTPRTIRQNIDAYHIPVSPMAPISKIDVQKAERFSAADLLQATLIASANNAAFALVESQGLSPTEFQSGIRQYLAREGYQYTTIQDPSGLGPANVSTADEYAHLAMQAFNYADIRSTTTKTAADIQSVSTGDQFHLRTTDRLLDSAPQEVLGGKTGYLDEAQYTFVVLTRHTSGRELLLVMLGADSSDQRFTESSRIIRWANNSYK